MTKAPTINLPARFSEPIRTDRMRLRILRPDDVDDVLAYQSREDVCRYLIFEPRTHTEVAAKLAIYSAAAVLRADGDFWQLALELEAEPGKVIGDLYFALASTANCTAEIGWTLHPDFAGQGYMTEAARALLAVAFGALGVHRVRAELDARNAASGALCRRLGMRREAHLVEDLWFKGAWGDTDVYAILATEWTARPPGGVPG
ncbi:MAG TPA: GNAT family protein [Solirubrobacteraceae bacterium]